jgi:hypothetical protein
MGTHPDSTVAELEYIGNCGESMIRKQTVLHTNAGSDPAIYTQVWVDT